MPLRSMFSELEKAPEIVTPSKFWQQVNEEHLKILDLKTFKSTLARQYFMFIPGRIDPQLQFLHAHVSKRQILRAFFKVLFSKSFPLFTRRAHLKYAYLTQLLWSYIQKELPAPLLEVNEPAWGMPPAIKYKNKYVTQDLANSLLEYDAIFSHVPGKSIRTILELGAGYGRTAAATLQLLPHVKYIIADIPPALYVAQSYLQEVFKEKKIFHFRPFNTYEEIRAEFEDASICFLLPHQLAQLPDKSIDLGMNISSFHEMRRDQISYYFSEFSRLIRGYFFFKQWKISAITHEETPILEKDYPIPLHWEEIFWKTCRVQTLFFEALFSTGD